MKLIPTSLFFLLLIIIAMATSPSFALGMGGINLLMIGVMALSPILIISYRKFIKLDVLLFLFMIAIIASTLGNNPESLRISTVIFTYLFTLTFIAYHQVLDVSKFEIVHYRNLLKYLIFAYCIVLIIQQFCVLTGLPIFNISNYDPGEPWKLNSLTSEPSHSGRIVGLLMFSYIAINEIYKKRTYSFALDFKEDKWVWFSFIWVMLTMGSGTAFVFVTIVFMKFIKFKNLLPLFLIFGLIAFITSLMNIDSFERSFGLLFAVFTGDINEMYKADHSGAFRIVPFFILFDKLEIFSLNGLFGHGIDYVSSLLSFYVRGLPEGSSGGGVLQIWMDYGFISFILFILFTIYASFNKLDFITFVFWFMLIFLNSINSQILWLTIILLFTNKYFEKLDLGGRKYENYSSSFR